MIDIHTHVLPAVDDGVKSEEEALDFGRMALADGIAEIVATPHCREGFFFNVREEILPGVERLKALYADNGLPLVVHPGAEVHLAPDLVERVRDGRAPTLADNGRTLLLELSLSQYPVELEQLVFQLKLAGIGVVFAHPERIRYFQEDINRYRQVVEQGAWGQITSGSITGSFGDDAATFSEELLREGLVHCIASDAHNTRGRPPAIRAAAERVEPWVGGAYAAAMVGEVPRAFLEGREPQLPPLAAARPSRTSFLSRWFGRGARGD